MRAQLSGRLGNQLFELAHAMDLSKHSGKKFSLNWDKYSYPSKLDDDLSKLNLDYLRKSNLVGLLLKILDKIKKHSPELEYALCTAMGVYREQHTKKPREVRVVSGFYQDYRWADSSCIEMKDLMEKARMQFQYEVDSLKLPRNYQAMHYRCGDYLGHSGNFGVLSIEYYKQNLDPTLPVIILTDSFDRATEKFKQLECFRIVSPIECSAWAALIVMSEADLIISSNSTLSWWGAFFAIKQGGRAVIPKPFFANGVQTPLFHPEFCTAESIFEERTE